MDMFNKVTAFLQQALETREPSINLLDSFVDHWKAITNYYIETTDESRPVKQTDIPWRLRQILDILVFEETQQGEETGPCMEYLLQHKILETLCTLGKAQYPPGMSQQVMLFFSKVLSQIQKPVLHLINVYRPVQKLIHLCGLPDSKTETEESQFLFVVCTRVKKDPYVLNYILEITKDSQKRCSSTSDEAVEEGCSGASSPERAPSSSAASSCSARSGAHPSSSPQTATGIIPVLMHLGKSQKSRVVLRSMESLLLLVSLPQEDTGHLLAEETPLCHLLAQRLTELYCLIPSSLDPADIHSFSGAQWRDQFTQDSTEENQSFPGSENVHRFFCFLDYCSELTKEAPRVLGVKMARAIHLQWLKGVIQPHLLQMSEVGILVHTALLSCSVRHIRSPALLEELVQFLLGSDTHCEQRQDTHTHILRYHLIEHCNHISDEISITTLRLFEELLQKPSKSILTNLVLRNLEKRSYRLPGSGVTDERHGVESDVLEESEELEEDPFFTDMYEDSGFGGQEPLLSLPSVRERRNPSEHTQVADIVNSFLCLVPQEAKTSHLVQGAGYDTYVHDAHKLLKECIALSRDWNWPDSAKTTETNPATDFYEGHFLQILFDRIARILEQPYELNLQVTSVLSKLAVLPHPHLHEYLLDPYISLSPGARSLFSTIVRVIGDLMQRVQHIHNVTDKLMMIRRQLMGLEEETMVDHVTLLKGVIVLEEFCKELAAIAFVKLPIEEQ
ncbi:FHF complex subunit HOOK-interacting protein 2B [Sinocyclocheilus rhinocerous]|uniref:FHF complex subunit HOOK-interacting protein 2B n=1 Tax=Sinocyclocheilus rhinocerous TaxID=307959 RepID=UPI0007B7971E|nr:PREDICTED: protein FAM160B2-like [Sinocyclocheilus rhinocerous]